MVFSSTIFLFMFLPITLVVYYLLKGSVRNYWLLAVSLLFFAWSQPDYLWIILLNIAINYASALAMQKKQLKKAALVIGVAANLGILIYFKYFDFILVSLGRVLRMQIDPIGIILPIGISFFTFQGMSYAIDVYREQVEVQRNPFKLALYIVLFPQLIAGPIVRYKDVAAEIDRRSISLDDLAYGAQRFIIGLAKKTIIANTMAEVVDAIWSRGAGNSMTSVAWIGSIAYLLQIFYDFSGYSDMAIGLGRMFGFHFNENFNLPYISRSMTEFWRRWHISLSTWFRDYVYIPLGGNRKRVYLNLSIVFLLTGIWHGAAWTFMAWGIWNGFFLVVERVLRNRKKAKAAVIQAAVGESKNSSEDAGAKSNADKNEAKAEPMKSVQRKTAAQILKDIAALFYALLVTDLGFVIFRAESLSAAAHFMLNMFGRGVASFCTPGYYLNRWVIFVGIAGIFFASSLPRRISGYFTAHVKVNAAVADVIRYAVLLLLLFVSMLRIVSGTYNPFIYFQF